jgi:hypothetical protein
MREAEILMHPIHQLSYPNQKNSFFHPSEKQQEGRNMSHKDYYGYYGYGWRRLLIFLLVIATIFVFAGVGFGY